MPVNRKNLTIGFLLPLALYLLGVLVELLFYYFHYRSGFIPDTVYISIPFSYFHNFLIAYAVLFGVSSFFLRSNLWRVGLSIFIPIFLWGAFAAFDYISPPRSFGIPLSLVIGTFPSIEISRVVEELALSQISKTGPDLVKSDLLSLINDEKLDVDPSQVILDKEGKILLVASVTNPRISSVIKITRLNSDGSLDASFGGNTKYLSLDGRIFFGDAENFFLLQRKAWLQKSVISYENAEIVKASNFEEPSEIILNEETALIEADGRLFAAGVVGKIDEKQGFISSHGSILEMLEDPPFYRVLVNTESVFSSAEFRDRSIKQFRMLPDGEILVLFFLDRLTEERGWNFGSGIAKFDASGKLVAEYVHGNSFGGDSLLRKINFDSFVTADGAVSDAYGTRIFEPSFWIDREGGIISTARIADPIRKTHLVRIMPEGEFDAEFSKNARVAFPFDISTFSITQADEILLVGTDKNKKPSLQIRILEPNGKLKRVIIGN
ncbi:delta-60 repeat domain-containing protein [Candidatus Kaiserbacteria bacterium]|nr:delta-60 repeat domain-containing protein [Candidatus Kaiserbacteria bacterium]